MICNSLESAPKSQIELYLRLLELIIDSSIPVELLDLVYDTLISQFKEFPSDIGIQDAVYRIAQHPVAIQSQPLLPSYTQLNKLIINDILNHHSIHSHRYIEYFLCNMNQHPFLMKVFSTEIARLLLFKESREELGSKHIPSEHYLRVLLLESIERIQSCVPISQLSESLYSILLHLLTFAVEETSSGRHIQNSEDSGLKMRCWQALCIVAKSLPELHHEEYNHQIQDLYCKAILQLNLKEIRFYIELFGIRLIQQDSSFIHVLLTLLKDPNQQAQAIPSLFIVTSYRMIHSPTEVDDQIKKAFVQTVIPWMISPEGLTRTIAQYIGYEVLKTMNEIGNTLTGLCTMLVKNKRIATMRKKQESIFNEYEDYKDYSVSILLKSNTNNINDFVPRVMLDYVQMTMNSVFSTWYQEDYPGYFHKDIVNENKETNDDQFDNFQRKILPWEESSKAEIAKREKQDIILIASLVDKLFALLSLIIF